MLSGGGAAEVQFLGQGHEIAKLPQVHVFTPSRPRSATTCDVESVRA
jgi:hypothetical protein